VLDAHDSASIICCLQAAAFERIKSGCLAPFPRSQYALVNVQPFGSYANGLSLAASDIDVVITGVTYPDDGRGGALFTSCPSSSAILLLQSLLALTSAETLLSTAGSCMLQLFQCLESAALAAARLVNNNNKNNIIRLAAARLVLHCNPSSLL